MHGAEFTGLILTRLRERRLPASQLEDLINRPSPRESVNDRIARAMQQFRSWGDDQSRNRLLLRRALLREILGGLEDSDTHEEGMTSSDESEPADAPREIDVRGLSRDEPEIFLDMSEESAHESM